MAALTCLAVDGSFAKDPAAAGEKDRVEIAALKRAYLACDHFASRGHLASADIRRCSTIYESLKARAFEGDFEKLRAWSRRQAVPTGASD